MSLLETIEQLAAARPLDKRAVEQHLGVALRGDPENQNRYIQVLKSFRVPAGIDAVELRVPLRGATRKDGFLIVDLDGRVAEAISQDDVRSRFGGDPLVDLPTAAQPAEAPVYLSYEHPWGALRFGFGRPGAERLTTLVVDVER